jgi:DNA-binding LytR/AlgR family response regulator
MWIRIRAVIIEDEPLAAQYLTELLDETCQVEVVGSATESEAGLRLCAELRPDAVFVDINLPGKDGVSLAKQLAMLPQPPHLVFTTGNPNRARDAFRFEAVAYLLKPLDPEQVNEAVSRLLAYLRPFEVGSSHSSGGHANGVPTADKILSTGIANELLPVKDVDRDRIRLLARREVTAALRRCSSSLACSSISRRCRCNTSIGSSGSGSSCSESSAGHGTQSVEMRQISFQPPGVRQPGPLTSQHDAFQRFFVAKVKADAFGLLQSLLQTPTPLNTSSETTVANTFALARSRGCKTFFNEVTNPQELADRQYCRSPRVSVWRLVAHDFERDAFYTVGNGFAAHLVDPWPFTPSQKSGVPGVALEGLWVACQTNGIFSFGSRLLFCNSSQLAKVPNHLTDYLRY